MISSRHKTRLRRLSAGAVFAAAWIAVIGLALALTVIGITLTGSASAFRDWLAAVTPYALFWRLAVYLVGGTFYVMRFRPRLRAMQAQQDDSGDASHARLIQTERLLIVLLVVIEATNLAHLIAWIRG